MRTLAVMMILVMLLRVDVNDDDMFDNCVDMWLHRFLEK